MTRTFAIQLCIFSLLIGCPGRAAATDSDNPIVREQIERAARSFRMQVYANFRTDRAEYDRRAGQAEQILEGWRQRGAPDLEVPALLDWFHQATRASGQSSESLLPEYHPFGDSTSVTRSPSAAPAPMATEPPVRPRPEVKLPPRHPGSERILPPELPLTNPERNRQRPELTAPKVVMTPTAPPEGPDPSPPQNQPSSSPVDLAVLGSRIRAFNLTLAEIESELSQPGPWPVDRLTNMIDQIERLFGRRHLSQIYYDALTADQRQHVLDFAPVELTLALLDQRLFEAQVALMDTNLELDPVYGQRELNQLRSLSERVKNWTVLRD